MTKTKHWSGTTASSSYSTGKGPVSGAGELGGAYAMPGSTAKKSSLDKTELPKAAAAGKMTKSTKPYKNGGINNIRHYASHHCLRVRR
jgi:hypothetical protein